MFEQRAVGKEILDGRHARANALPFARHSYETMTAAHRYLGSFKTIRQFLSQEADHLPTHRTLRVLDMGAGDCGVGADILRWSQQTGVPVHLTCVDDNVHAIRLAKQRFGGDDAASVDLCCERIQDHSPTENYDCAIGSLFFHHFSGAEIVRLLEQLRSMVRRSVLINDLLRSPTAHMAFICLFPLLAPEVWRDGLMSIRRGFDRKGLCRILRGVPAAEFTVNETCLFRIVGRLRFTH